jgi:fatty acid desaturase
VSEKMMDAKQKGVAPMRRDSHIGGYIVAAALGAIGGGFMVAVVTRAVPRMMAGMMQNMMARMGEEGAGPGVM